MNEAEKILENFARKNMVEWNQESFKKTHGILHKSIIEAIDEAFCLAHVMESVCSCSKGKGIDHDEDGKAYCIDCGNYLEQTVP